MEEINLLEVFEYFKLKLIWILIAVLAAVVLGNTYTMITRVPMYKSNTTIVLVNEKQDTYSQSDLYMNQNLVGTYSEIVKSRKVISQVIKNLKLSYSVDELSSHINVSSVGETEIISIQVTDKNSLDAKNIANEIARVFIKEVKDYYNLENVSILDKEKSKSTCKK